MPNPNELVEPFVGNTTVDDNTTTDPVEAEYATAADMIDYVSPETFNDYLALNGSHYRVRTGTRKLRSYSRRILVPQVLDAGPGTIAGYAFRELTGAATATVAFRDGIDSNAPIIFELNLAAGESTRDWYGIDGVSYRYGLYIDISAGSAAGNLFNVVETYE